MCCDGFAQTRDACWGAAAERLVRQLMSSHVTVAPQRVQEAASSKLCAIPLSAPLKAGVMIIASDEIGSAGCSAPMAS